jgi:hypothetical protein
MAWFRHCRHRRFRATPAGDCQCHDAKGYLAVHIYLLVLLVA